MWRRNNESGPVFALAVYMLYICAAAAQESAAVKPYDADEAYQVYSVLLPHESYVSALRARW